VGSSMMTTVCGEDAPDLPISGNQLATRCHNSHAPKNSIVAAGQLRNENQNFGTIFQSCVSKIQHNDGRRARSINRDHFDPDGWERDLSENALSVTPITYQNC